MNYCRLFFGRKPEFSHKVSIDAFLSGIFTRIFAAAAKLGSAEDSFRNDYEITKTKMTSNKNTLIITSTPLEAKALFKALELENLTASPISINKTTFWNFGVLGNSDLFVLKLGDMGSSKPSGSSLSIHDAIQELKPDYVIMLGIAFGLKPDRQKIGDVLISRELQDYDSKKRTEAGDIQRGYRIPAGATLLNRFDNAAIQYTAGTTEVGFIISGDSLADSKEFVQDLIHSFPEAIGAEMEGTGLQSSCHRDGREWILIKGICDWGYDKQHPDKERDQELAINNVCRFLTSTLKIFDF